MLTAAFFLSQLQVASPAYVMPLQGPGDYESILIDLSVDPASEERAQFHVMSGDKQIGWLETPILRDVDGFREGNVRIAVHIPAGNSPTAVLVTVGDTTRSVAIARYEQKNTFVFPLQGNGLITQGPFNNGGHSGRSTRFANDVIGLDANYAPMLGSEETNENMAGFGMPVIAPADGTVTFVQTGIRDQQGGYDDTSFQLADGTVAHWGNAVVIDHGDGEFVSLMHLKAGSVSVNVGDKVTQGQKLGEMGNSGDSFGAHLHIQLQDGPTPDGVNGLPIKFSDQGDRYLRRGQFVSKD